MGPRIREDTEVERAVWEPPLPGEGVDGHRIHPHLSLPPSRGKGKSGFRLGAGMTVMQSSAFCERRGSGTFLRAG